MSKVKESVDDCCYQYFLDCTFKLIADDKTQPYLGDPVQLLERIGKSELELPKTYCGSTTYIFSQAQQPYVRTSALFTLACRIKLLSVSHAQMCNRK